MQNIYGITLEKLEKYFIDKNDKKFKATQVFEWVYKKRVNSFDDMKNVSKETINELKEDFYFEKLEIVKKLEDVDVIKYLFRRKKVRNLEVYEMVTQILMVESDINKRLSHIVLMGIGEPFDNYDNVIDFIDIVNSGKGIDIGSRHITVSTCGIVPKIKKFTNFDKQVNLAISLHAPNNEIRSSIMNINKVYPIEDIIEAVKEYIAKTNRRVTFEYIMLKGVNDTVECAIELSQLLKGLNAYVNLIPYNETSHIEYKKSSKDTIMKFFDVLKRNGIQVTIRREFGSKVNAACGQLRSHYEEV